MLILLAVGLIVSWVSGLAAETKSFLRASIAILVSNAMMYDVDLSQSIRYWQKNGVVKGLARLPGVVISWPFRTLDGIVAPNWSKVNSLFARREFFVRGTSQVGEGIYTFSPYGAIALVFCLLCLRHFFAKQIAGGCPSRTL